MVAERPRLLAFFVVPDLDNIIGPGTGEQLAVGLPAHVENVVSMALERFEELAGRDVKHLDELVRAASGQLGAVGTEANAEDLVAVPAFNIVDELAARHVE